MAIPLIIPILTGIGGLVAGALSRQPEINRLKEQVKILQSEIIRLQGVIKEQQRQIEELKIRFNTLKASNFIEKKRILGITKGFLYLQYAFREYVELTIVQARGKELRGDELRFYITFNCLMNEQDMPVEERLFVAQYVSSIYKYQIDNLLPLSDSDQEALIKRVETANVN